MTERRSIVPRGSGNQPVRRTTRPTTSGSHRTSGQPRSGSTQTRTRPPSVQPRSGTTRTGGSGPRGPRSGEIIQGDAPRWKRVLKRIGKWTLITGLAMITLALIALMVRYASLDVPEPDDFAAAQSSTIYYADGETVMGRLGVADREVIALDTLPEHVPNAFIAAEDRTFYTNPGVDIRGTTRALFQTVVRGQRQGGSTITQQYIENYYMGQTSNPSLRVKLDEALLALKVDREQEKEMVLENYLNTIYFGRGAYGIQAAARQYFDKEAADLTVSEAAMLAGIIPAPSAWDPRLSPERAEQRWNFVLDGMVIIDALEQERRDRQSFPDVAEYRNSAVFAGPQGHLLRTAINEIVGRGEITQEQIETRGYTIITTVDPVAQRAAEDAVAEMPDDHDPNLRVAAITMDPATGAITSMYGGRDYLEIQRNAVTQDIAQAGSTFKPFALVAALERGIALETEYVSNHNMTLPGFDNPVRNFGGVSYGQINLIRATEASVNTAYVQLANEIGAAAVRDTAIAAGIPEDTLGLEDNPANVLGSASPRALDMASAYATFANNGIRTEPFMVQSVVTSGGEEVYVHEVVEEFAFAEDVMAENTYALSRVVQAGSGAYARELGRPVAGKTGTANENRSAWFVGYTPQVVGAVALYQVGEDGSAEEITTFGGFSQITGSTIPVRVWTWMMEPILEQYEVEQFPARTNIGVATSPSPSPEPSPTPTPTPTPTPVFTPEPEPSPEPSPSPTPTMGLIEAILPWVHRF